MHERKCRSPSGRVQGCFTDSSFWCSSAASSDLTFTKACWSSLGGDADSCFTCVGIEAVVCNLECKGVAVRVRMIASVVGMFGIHFTGGDWIPGLPALGSAPRLWSPCRAPHNSMRNRGPEQPSTSVYPLELDVHASD